MVARESPLSYGGAICYPSRTDNSQAYVYALGSISANATITVKSGDTVLKEFTVPAEYQGDNISGGGGPGGGEFGGDRPGGMGCGSVMVCPPELTSGESYTLLNGSNSTTVTARLSQ